MLRCGLAIAFLAICFLTFGFLRLSGQEQAKPSLQPQFEPGQIWKYKTAPGEEGATLLILRVEAKEKKGNVIHIRVDNIPVPCGNLHVTTTFEHVAVTDKALRQSATEL